MHLLCHKLPSIKRQWWPSSAVLLLILVGLFFPKTSLLALSAENQVEITIQTQAPHLTPDSNLDSLKEKRGIADTDSLAIRSLPEITADESKAQNLLTVRDTSSRLEPWQVVLWSIALPGFGQFYNESYWKMPLVYGGLGAMMYLALTNNTLYLDFRQRYITSLNSNDPLAESNRRLRDFYRTNRDQYYIFFVAVYAIAILDAYIDAHFFGFETSDNLSIRIAPDFGPSQNALTPPVLQGATVGIQIGF